MARKAREKRGTRDAFRVTKVEFLDINNLPREVEQEADKRALKFAMQSNHTTT